MSSHAKRVLFRQFVLVAALTLGCTSAAFAQGNKADIEEIELLAKDNVIIKANYYHGNESKDTVPVILVHGEGGQRAELDGLAKALQAKGHAVLVPDLRGHGDSTDVQGQPNTTLDHNKMRPADFALCVYDMEACKNYFKELNNDQKVNIENLTVIGMGPFGSVLAFAYSGEDWLVRPFGRFKQGQDVKAVILFSPVQREKTINSSGYMDDTSVRQGMSFFLIVNNNDNRAKRDATRFEAALKRAASDKDDKERISRLDVPTTLKGVKILEVKEADEIMRRVNLFIETRVTDKKYEWNERR